MMNEKEKGLNLPAIKKNDGLPKNSNKKIESLDLNRKSSVSSILNEKASSVQSNVFNAERGLDLVLVGDLTASMTDYHQLLKNKFMTLCNELFPLIKNLRIGIVFYLDHYNQTSSPGPDNAYITRVQKLTVNREELISFIHSSTTGNGYDNDEAVEDALHDLNSNMNWKESNASSVVIFGEASPHRAYECPFHYDFFELTKSLFNKGVTFNSVYCSSYSQKDLQKLQNTNVGDFRKRIDYLDSPNFFSWIANVTGGMVLGIDNIEDLVDIIKASAAKDSGNLDELEKKSKPSPSMLKLIDVARKAEQRKRLGDGNDRKMIG
jgi:hypothetical protein